MDDSKLTGQGKAGKPGMQKKISEAKKRLVNGASKPLNGGPVDLSEAIEREGLPPTPDEQKAAGVKEYPAKPRRLIRKETPQAAKEIFGGFLFPCQPNKLPAVRKGETWAKSREGQPHKESGEPLKLSRIGETKDHPLCGLDLEHADLLAADFDTQKAAYRAAQMSFEEYKAEVPETGDKPTNLEDFKKAQEGSKAAQAFHEHCRRISAFRVRTPSGGEHIFFRGGAPSSNPWPSVDIKGAGGYVCLYNLPFVPGALESFEDFYEALPECPFGSAIAAKNGGEHREFGPGKNHRAIPQRAGKAGARRDTRQMETDLNELIGRNPGNPELSKHLVDYVKKSLDSALKARGGGKNAAKADGQKEGQTAEPPELLALTEAGELPCEKPIAFHESGLIQKHEFNFFYGAAKLGKTRGIILLIKEGLKELGKAAKAIILSTENDPEYMLVPLLRGLAAESRFLIASDKAAKWFKDASAAHAEKIAEFLERLKALIETSKAKALLLDPMPRFLDWNNETLATLMIDGLREIAKTHQVTIIGVRNEGKNKQYDSENLYKGSSGIGDNTRQVVRVLLCHPKSAYGKKATLISADDKKGPRRKAFAIYTELSSLSRGAAALYELRLKDIGKGFEVAIPQLIGPLEPDFDKIKFNCERKSGRKLKSRILEYLQGAPGRGCSLDDLYDEFGDFFPENTIRVAANRSFEVATLGNQTWVSLPPEAERKGNKK